MLVEAIIDLDRLGIPLDQWQLMHKNMRGLEFWKKYQEPLTYSSHIRDFTEGWIRIGSIAEWQSKEWAVNRGLTCPGTYALVYDHLGATENPMLTNQVIIFGETTQAAWKRLGTHVGALKGTTTNMSDKWSKHKSKVNDVFCMDIDSELDKIIIFFRPHNLTDPDWQYDRKHSSLMETQAHAQYHAIWGHGTPANTRDLPSKRLIENSKIFFRNKGYTFFDL